MKKIVLLSIFSVATIVAKSQNTFPATGNAEIKSGNLLIETDTWRSSLLTLKDTHYSPAQIYHFQIESDGLKIKQDGTTNYQFRSGGNFLVRNGRIGIGLTNPSFQLHLKDPTGGAAMALERDGKLWRFDVAYNAASKLFIGHSDHSGVLTLTDQGMMGVGDSAPEERLHVNGNNRIDGNLILNSKGGDAYNALSFKHQETTKWLMDYGTGPTDNLRVLRFSAPSSANTVLNFNFDSNLVEFPTAPVAIATTSTGSHKLAVGGSIGAREIKVEASGWSDFVFEKDYELRSLEEVEQYIEENGHLPEIPNEAEVTENGINLGEMNAKLLQKVEELTLYLIEEHKSNKQLQQEIQKLKEEVTALKGN